MLSQERFGEVRLELVVRTAPKFDDRLTLLRRGRRILRDGVVDGGCVGTWVREEVGVDGAGAKLDVAGVCRLGGQIDVFSLLSFSLLSSLSVIETPSRRSPPLFIISPSSLSFRFFPLSRTSVSSSDNLDGLRLRFRELDVGYSSRNQSTTRELYCKW
jgi:hypothetical protein